MSRGAVATIDLTALAHNFLHIQQLVKHRSIMAMIKSNAYGHGLLPIAKTLKNAQALGVACLEEAITLRLAGINQPIVVMAGFSNTVELNQFLLYQLMPVIHNQAQIQLIEQTTFLTSLSAWLKIDTGMHRLGFPITEIKKAYTLLKNKPGIRLQGIMTHLADAYNPKKDFTLKQLQLFSEKVDGINIQKSVVNSAGILRYSQAFYDWVRPGIILYGVSPFQGRIGKEEGLLPVMTLRAKLIACHDLKKGENVGYGCLWQCPNDMRIGVVAIGYGDGYPRHAKQGTPTLVNDQVCPLIGHVSMDMITIDLTRAPHAKIGDNVILWGKELPVEKIAEHAATIPYELLCQVTSRVKNEIIK